MDLDSIIKKEGLKTNKVPGQEVYKRLKPAPAKKEKAFEEVKLLDGNTVIDLSQHKNNIR